MSRDATAAMHSWVMDSGMDMSGLGRLELLGESDFCFLWTLCALLADAGIMKRRIIGTERSASAALAVVLARCCCCEGGCHCV